MIQRATGEGGDQTLTAEAAGRHAPAMPRRFGAYDANAHFDQGLDVVDQSPAAGDTLILRYSPREETLNAAISVFFTYGIRELLRN